MADSGITLAIDTSGAVSVAVARGGKVLAKRLDARARHHDEVLLPMIDEVLAEAGADRTEITRVIAGRGPGPFTGLRVGLVTARSIATVLGAELWGVPSLDAIAAQVAAVYQGSSNGGESVQNNELKSIGVALDARRKEVYYALYEVQADGTAVRVSEMAVAKPEEAAQVLGQASVLVGSGAHLYSKILPPCGDIQYADAGYLIIAAHQAEKRGEAEVPGAGLYSTEPLYLREADAAKPTKRKSALGLEERSI